MIAKAEMLPNGRIHHYKALLIAKRFFTLRFSPNNHYPHEMFLYLKHIEHRTTTDNHPQLNRIQKTLYGLPLTEHFRN